MINPLKKQADATMRYATASCSRYISPTNAGRSMRQEVSRNTCPNIYLIIDLFMLHIPPVYRRISWISVKPVCVVTIITVSPSRIQSWPLGMIMAPLRFINEMSISSLSLSSARACLWRLSSWWRGTQSLRRDGRTCGKGFQSCCRMPKRYHLNLNR